MRSKGDIDIGAVAKEFGGGGHKNAAGCTVSGAIDALQKTFVEKLLRAIDMQDAGTAIPQT
jgi:phosphoesterase RecJ-like protein